jgi:hypothetical protein
MRARMSSYCRSASSAARSPMAIAAAAVCGCEKRGIVRGVVVSGCDRAQRRGQSKGWREQIDCEAAQITRTRRTSELLLRLQSQNRKICHTCKKSAERPEKSCPTRTCMRCASEARAGARRSSLKLDGGAAASAANAEDGSESALGIVAASAPNGESGERCGGEGSGSPSHASRDMGGESRRGLKALSMPNFLQMFKKKNFRGQNFEKSGFPFHDLDFIEKISGKFFGLLLSIEFLCRALITRWRQPCRATEHRRDLRIGATAEAPQHTYEFASMQ